MERKNGVRTEQHGTLMLNKSELRELRFINKFQKKGILFQTYIN